MYWDDLTVGPLDIGEVRRARVLDIECSEKMNVYTKVPLDEAKSGGHQVLGVRWVDAVMAGGTYCSRLVARELKTYNAPELFVATPPIESLKYLVRRASQCERMNVMHVDVTCAYLYAEASRNIHVRLPVEDKHGGDEYMCGKLNKAMYDARDAAQNRQRGEGDRL